MELEEKDRFQIEEECLVLESKLHLHELPFEDKLKEIMTNNILREKKETKHQLLDDMQKKVYWKTETNDNMKREMVSNSRIVEWEDGSYGMYIGDKYFDLLSKPNTSEFIFGQSAQNPFILTKKTNPTFLLNLKTNVK